jgi:hypothetical protein
MSDSKLEPEAYIGTFFDTGTERQTITGYLLPCWPLLPAARPLLAPVLARLLAESSSLGGRPDGEFGDADY